MSGKVLVGKVAKYYEKPGVIAIELLDELGVGDTMYIETTATKLEQKVRSMEIEHIPVNHGFRGDSVGVKVDQPVEEGSEVYKLI
jgi:translation elongation factor EF-1alpha